MWFSKMYTQFFLPINVSDNPRYFTLFVLIEYLRHVIKSARPPKIVTQTDMDLIARKEFSRARRQFIKDPIIRINNFHCLVIHMSITCLLYYLYMFAILLWSKTKDINHVYFCLQLL